MSETIALRSLANAIETLERIESFQFNGTDCTGMCLTWSTGSATSGYKELQQAMSKVCASMWDEIRYAAVCRAREEVDRCRKQIDGKFLECRQRGGEVKMRPIETAPRDGSYLILLVEYSDDEHCNPLYDASAEALLPTIGFNNFENDGEDVWKLCGWDWCQDCFTEGVGTPKYWISALPGHPDAIISRKEDYPGDEADLDFPDFHLFTDRDG